MMTQNDSLYNIRWKPVEEIWEIFTKIFTQAQEKDKCPKVVE